MENETLTVIEAAALAPYSTRLISATCDDEVVKVWLENMTSDNTRALYKKITEDFRAFVGVELRALKLEDMLAYKNHLATLISGPTGKPYSQSTQNTHMAAVKSLLSFAHGSGYSPFNVGKIVRVAKVEEKRAERILTEEEVLKMVLAAQKKGKKKGKNRDELLIRFIYRTAARASEVVGLRWRQLQPRESGGQASFFGKGRKTRSVLIPEKLWDELMATRGEAADDDPVFCTYAGGISRTQVWRVVKKVALIAGARSSATTHSLRHAHASHALDHNAPIQLVSTTLGHENIATTNVYAHARTGESSGSYLKVG